MNKLPSLQHSVLAAGNILLPMRIAKIVKLVLLSSLKVTSPKKNFETNVPIPRFMEYNFWNSNSHKICT